MLVQACYGHTSKSKGSAFLWYEQQQHAVMAILAMHGQLCLPRRNAAAARPLTVRPALHSRKPHGADAPSPYGAQFLPGRGPQGGAAFGYGGGALYGEPAYGGGAPRMPAIPQPLRHDVQPPESGLPFGGALAGFAYPGSVAGPAAGGGYAPPGYHDMPPAQRGSAFAGDMHRAASAGGGSAGFAQGHPGMPSGALSGVGGAQQDAGYQSMLDSLHAMSMQAAGGDAGDGGGGSGAGAGASARPAYAHAEASGRPSQDMAAAPLGEPQSAQHPASYNTLAPSQGDAGGAAGAAPGMAFAQQATQHQQLLALLQMQAQRQQMHQQQHQRQLSQPQAQSGPGGSASDAGAPPHFASAGHHRLVRPSQDASHSESAVVARGAAYADYPRTQQQLQHQQQQYQLQQQQQPQPHAQEHEGYQQQLQQQPSAPLDWAEQSAFGQEQSQSQQQSELHGLSGRATPRTGGRSGGSNPSRSEYEAALAAHSAAHASLGSNPASHLSNPSERSNRSGLSQRDAHLAQQVRCL